MPAIVDQAKCDGSAKCVDVCPNESVQIVDGKAVVNEDECMDCGECETECPNGAIKVE